MLDIDPDALAIAFERRIRGKADRRTAAHPHPGGVAAMIRVLALLHVVLVTTGAMDSSWAMAKKPRHVARADHPRGRPVAITATGPSTPGSTRGFNRSSALP